MTVTNFNGSSDEVITALGSANLTGAFTIASLVKLDAIGRAHTIMMIRDSSAVARVAMGIQLNNYFVFDVNGDGLSAANSGVATAYTAQATRWYLFVGTHPAGTTTPRLHMYDFTAATWTHKDGANNMANAATQAGGTVRFGGMYASTWVDGSQNWLDGSLAAAAVWNIAMNDAQVEALQTASSLSGWASLNSPLALWLFSGSPLQDTIGAADETSRSGTTLPSESPPIPYDPPPTNNVFVKSGGVFIPTATYVRVV